MKQGRNASEFRSELAGLPYQIGSSVFFYPATYHFKDCVKIGYGSDPLVMVKVFAKFIIPQEALRAIYD